MSSASLRQRFADHLASTGLLHGEGEVLVAVSGGGDSLALLDLVADWSRGAPVTVHAVHADHGIHEHSGAVAAAVERHVQGRYGLGVTVGRLALGPGATETAARVARYRWFRWLQAERGARWIATAHHADDQAETVLLRLLRGSGPAGLAGIPARGPRGLIRPLLPFHRAELGRHLAEAGVAVLFDDPANLDQRHTRAWVRHAVLPLLDDRLGPAAAAALLASAGQAAADVAAWDALLDVLPGLDPRWQDGRFDVARSVLAGYDKPLAERILRAAARRSGMQLGPQRARRLALFAARAASGRRAELGAGLIAEAAFDRLVVGRVPSEATPVELGVPSGTAECGRLRVTWRPEPAPADRLRTGWTAWFTPGALLLRSPRPGDRMRPLGGTGQRSVRRLVMEARIARLDRPAWPVVDREGEVLWIPGVCRGASAVPAPGAPAVRVDAEAS